MDFYEEESNENFEDYALFKICCSEKMFCYIIKKVDICLYNKQKGEFI